VLAALGARNVILLALMLWATERPATREPALWSRLLSEGKKWPQACLLARKPA
jgi:hypothetical protein